MTKAEAIDILFGCIEAHSEEENEALDMAIEALEQVTGKLNNPDDSLLTADSEACKEQKSKLDLISRAETIEAIELVDWYHQNSNKDMVHGANDDEHQAWYKADDVYKALEAVPSANRPKGEPKTGEWVNTAPSDRSDNIVCDQCGYNSIARYDYCPNCGAEMKGEGE